MKNLSGSITAGGTAQVLAAANLNRNGYRIENISAGDLWYNDTGGTAATNAAGSYKLSPGDYYETPRGMDAVQAISIFGATTAQSFSAAEW